MNKYRFDDVYGKVYEYDNKAQAYIHIGSYFMYGISAEMSDVKKERIVSCFTIFLNRYPAYR